MLIRKTGIDYDADIVVTNGTPGHIAAMNGNSEENDEG